MTTDLTGPADRRDGRLRTAISELIRLARAHDCAGIAIENLGFDDARTIGRETMGRGRRGKKFRRTVAGMPTAKFRDRLRGMAYHQGLTVVAVDPAYSSRWGAQHWQRPLHNQSTAVVTRHHGAAVAIGRRALGYGIRRRPGVTAHDQRIVARRATGQTVTPPMARWDREPAQDRRHAPPGRQDLEGPGRTTRAAPAPKTVRGATGHSPESTDMANTG